MSRAYRIKVSETLKRILHARDGVSTQLEILPILSPEQMTQLLAAELEARGYERKGVQLQKTLPGNVVVTVDPATGIVTVQAEACTEVELTETRDGRAWEERSQKSAEESLRDQIRGDMRKRADEQEAQMQGEVSDRLEKIVGDLRVELDQAVNKVTADALKTKAAQIGQIKQITDDPQTGSLTIVVEV